MINLEMFNQKGQIVVVLLLTMLVALSIGLVVTQKTITDVGTSTQNEQSSRAFSAAEAGIEKALQQSGSFAQASSIPAITNLGNEATSQDIQISPDLPTQATEALEYPKINKETIAQFWLANPTDLTQGYTGERVSLYFGNPTQDPNTPLPAVELSIIYYDTNLKTYRIMKHYLDSDPSRSADNGFQDATEVNLETIQVQTFNPATFTSENSKFYAVSRNLLTGCSLNCYPVIARARLLYSSKSQKIALAPATGSNGFPKQANIYTSTGRAGQSQKKLTVFRGKYYVPPFFDFGIFTLGDIKK